MAGKRNGEILRYLAGISAAPSTTSSLASREQNREQERPSVGALIHCSAGKDRTGIFFGLLFDFLGVPRDIIAEEYHLTESGLAGIRDKVVPRLMQSVAFKQYMAGLAGGSQAPLAGSKETAGEGEGKTEEASYPPKVLEQGRKAALRMVGARKESMLGSLEMLDRVFGGAEAYIRKECGLGDEELEALRRNLVV